MTYLPTELINQNYTYYTNGDYITVRKNTNCYNNYNTTYCDCIDVFPKLDYIQSTVYSCSLGTQHNLSYTTFKSDYFHRLDLPNILIIGFVILFGFIFLLKCMISALMKGMHR